MLFRSVKQTKGDSWAIRKPLHKETVSGAVTIKRIKKGEIRLNSYLDKPEFIVDKEVQKKVNYLHGVFLGDIKKIKQHLKEHPLNINGKTIDKIQVYEWTEGATATRTPLSDKFTRKQLEAVTDSGIQTILNNHVKKYLDENGKEQFDLAFSQEGIEDMNTNIEALNNGKRHKPIRNVRIYEVGNKFPVSENRKSPKSTKYVEAAKGTNLYFAIYWDDEKQKRVFETIPFNEVVEHQKQRATLSKEIQKNTPSIPINKGLGQFLFSLSPNDLVYVPTEEEVLNPGSVNIKNFTNEQISRIYKMVSCTGAQGFLILSNVATAIYDKFEYATGNKMERDLDGAMIKDCCWKLEIDRLGNITNMTR